MTTSLTPNMHLPYPEGDEFVIGGDDAIEALGKAVDTAHVTHLVAIPRAESAAAAAANAIVDYPAPFTQVVGFTRTGGVFNFVGNGPRMFVIAAEVQVTIPDAGSNAASSCIIRVDEAEEAGSYSSLALTDGLIGQHNVVHSVSVPVLLVPGQSIDVTASASPAGALGVVGLRIYPIGPTLA